MPTFIQPFPQRSTFSEDAEGLHISIPPKRAWTIFFFVLWLTFWTYAGIQVGHKLLSHFDLFTAVWMIGWAFAEIWVSFGILYILAGCEIIVATSENLSRKTTIFGLGPTKSYVVREMRDLRYQPELGTGRGRKASQIAFDYGAKTVRFARDIEEAEAAELITRIKQRCSIAQNPSPKGPQIRFWQQR
jgi:hypothetical protein